MRGVLAQQAQSVEGTELGRQLFLAAIPYAQQAGMRQVNAILLSMLGASDSDLGRTDSALSYLGQALSAFRDIGSQSGEAYVTAAIGAIYGRIGRVDSASAYLRAALSTFRATGDRLGEANTLNQIAAILSDADSALAYYREAGQVHLELGGTAGVAASLRGIALVHTELLAQADSGIAYFRGALEVSRASSDYSGVALAAYGIGRAYRGEPLADSSLHYLLQALPIFRYVGNRYMEAHVLGNIGGVYQFDLAPPELAQAVAYYDSAASVAASILVRSGGDQNRVTFAERAVAIYDAWPLAWLGQETVIGARNAQLAALAATERGRAQALLDLMTGPKDSITPGGDFVEEGEHLLESVGADATVVSYWVTDDSLIAWWLGPPNRIEIVRRSVGRDSLSRLVAMLRTSIGADDRAIRSRLAPSDETTPYEAVPAGQDTVLARTAAHLGDLLFPPKPFFGNDAGAHELVVVPHGPLTALPFAILPFGDQRQPLGDRYALRYAPSLRSLNEASARPAAELYGRALVVGNPSMPTVKLDLDTEIRLSSLPGAESEARWVADRLGVSVLFGKSASEPEVRNRLRSASLAHLATHAYVYTSEARARDTFLALAPADGHDGLLTVALFPNSSGHLSLSLEGREHDGAVSAGS